MEGLPLWSLISTISSHVDLRWSKHHLSSANPPIPGVGPIRPRYEGHMHVFLGDQVGTPVWGHSVRGPAFPIFAKRARLKVARRPPGLINTSCSFSCSMCSQDLQRRVRKPVQAEPVPVGHAVVAIVAGGVWGDVSQSSIRCSSS